MRLRLSVDDNLTSEFLEPRRKCSVATCYDREPRLGSGFWVHGTVGGWADRFPDCSSFPAASPLDRRQTSEKVRTAAKLWIIGGPGSLNAIGELASQVPISGKVTQDLLNWHSTTRFKVESSFQCRLKLDKGRSLLTTCIPAYLHTCHTPGGKTPPARCSLGPS